MIEKNQPAQGGPESKTHRQDTKIARILDELRAGRSLNRFEAERIGDHCLHSTISQLRAEGVVILDHWEEVPTRFGRPVRVKRYRFAGSRGHMRQQLFDEQPH